MHNASKTRKLIPISFSCNRVLSHTLFPLSSLLHLHALTDVMCFYHTSALKWKRWVVCLWNFFATKTIPNVLIIWTKENQTPYFVCMWTHSGVIKKVRNGKIRREWKVKRDSQESKCLFLSLLPFHYTKSNSNSNNKHENKLSRFVASLNRETKKWKHETEKKAKIINNICEERNPKLELGTKHSCLVGWTEPKLWCFSHMI